LPAAERDQLIAEYYEPHRESVIQTVQRLGRTGPVLHVGVHSFTPVLKGRTRRTDIGLLFDPRRKFESAVCQAWRQALRDLAPELKVHFNLPYRGVSDGLTTALRTHFPDERYAGVELEVNQKFPLGERRAWKQLQQTLQASLTETMKSKMI
jgi:predicted N-formylglutamate amidohydrolase